MAEMKRVRIGFVGVGSMGQCAHLKNYVRLDGCEVVALAELRQKTGRAVAHRYGVPNVYADASEMLAAEELDGIVASQPFDRHGLMLRALAPAGKPLFIEKPLAASVQVGEDILQVLAGSDARVMVGYHKRSDPATEYAKAEIDRLRETGELGRLTYVRILMPEGDWAAGGFADLIPTQDGDESPDLQRDPPAADMDDATRQAYIGFVNYYIHQVNLMRHLLGEPYRVAYADPSGVLLAGVSDGGAACSIEMTPYRTTVGWEESALVCFARGYVKLELPAPLASARTGRVEVYSDPGDGRTPVRTSPAVPSTQAMLNQAQRFLEFVRGAEPPCGPAEALEDLKIAREYIRLLRGQ